MFPEPTELLLIGCSIESTWTQNPNQIHWHQEPFRRHTDKGKFHTWWMESSFVFVQHQPFQFHQLSWSDVEKNARRCRWRKSQQQNRSRWWIWSRDTAQGIQTCLPLLHQKARWKPNLKFKYLWARGMSSNQERGDLWWALVHQTTQNGILTKKWSSQEWKSGENVGSRNGETCEWTTSRCLFTQDTDKFVIDDDDMDSNTATESDLSLKSRSILHRVNDRVREIMDQSSKDAMQGSN